MSINRRNFLASSLSSSAGMMSLGTVSGCGSGSVLSDDHISRILGDYLHVGQEHRETIRLFIDDLRAGRNTTEGPEENAALLSGDRGLAATERYVIQEFVRFSNYRMWIRRSDQPLGPTSEDPVEDPPDEI